MLKVTFEAPKFEVAHEVKNLFKKKERVKKDQLPKFWSHKERLVVGAFLFATIILIAYFWYKGQGRLPSVGFGGAGFNQKVILEK